MSTFITKRKSRADLAMSASGGGPEVMVRPAKRRECPKADEASFPNHH